jgi:hypothetical protein
MSQTFTNFSQRYKQAGWIPPFTAFKIEGTNNDAPNELLNEYINLSDELTRVMNVTPVVESDWQTACLHMYTFLRQHRLILKEMGRYIGFYIAVMQTIEERLILERLRRGPIQSNDFGSFGGFRKKSRSKRSKKLRSKKSRKFK